MRLLPWWVNALNAGLCSFGAVLCYLSEQHLVLGINLVLVVLNAAIAASRYQETRL